MTVAMDNQRIPAKPGEDRVSRRGEQLIVCSRVDMGDWQIRQTRKTGIRIDGELWCLVEKQRTTAGEIRYLLEPWTEIQREIPGRVINYNEEYVRTRDEAEKRRKTQSRIGPILYPLSGIVGFLPSRIKSRIEAEFGITAQNATFISIIIELLLFFLLGAFLLIAVFGTMTAPQLVIYIPCLIVPVPVLAVDLLMRYDSYLREDASPWGLFEWVVSRRKRVK